MENGTDQQTPNLFVLPNDYVDLLIYAGVHASVELNEEQLQNYLKDNALINSFYLLNQKKNIIIIVKNSSDKPSVIEYLVKNEDVKFELQSIPYSNFSSVLVGELSDTQLKQLASDKSSALKLIESRTGRHVRVYIAKLVGVILTAPIYFQGLKLKKQKKSFYFNGLLFQFNLLNELFKDTKQLETESTETGVQDVEIKQDVAGVEEQDKKLIDEFTFDLNTVTYYRKLHDLNFNNLKARLNLNNIYVTKCAGTQSTPSCTINYEICEPVPMSETPTTVLNEPDIPTETSKTEVTQPSSELVLSSDTTPIISNVPEASETVKTSKAPTENTQPLEVSKTATETASTVVIEKAIVAETQTTKESIKLKLNEIFQKLKASLIEVKIEFENKKRDLANISQIINEETCAKSQILFLTDAQHSLKLIGAKDDLEMFLKLNNSSLRLLENRSTKLVQVWMVNLKANTENQELAIFLKETQKVDWKLAAACGLVFASINKKAALYVYEGNVHEQSTECVVYPFNVDLSQAGTECEVFNGAYDVFLNHLKTTKGSNKFQEADTLSVKMPLDTRHVIYTCVPLWSDYGNRRLSEFEQVLRQCYERVLLEADKKLFKTISMPLLSYIIDDFVSIDVCVKCFHEVLSSISLKNLTTVCLISATKSAQAISTRLVGSLQAAGTSQTASVSTPPTTAATSPTLSITLLNQHQHQRQSPKRIIKESKSATNVLQCCLMCQLEEQQKLINCFNPKCNTSFCNACLIKYEKNQRTDKCPNCKWTFENAGTELKQPRKPTSLWNGLTSGRLTIDILDESCEGYDRSVALKVNLVVKDGVQSSRHPEPGEPYIGVIKYVYLPQINDSNEILRLLENCLRNGKLFQLDFDTKLNEYKAVLNQVVVFKTKLYGGGRYGYPDSQYVSTLMKVLRQLQ